MVTGGKDATGGMTEEFKQSADAESGAAGESINIVTEERDKN